MLIYCKLDIGELYKKRVFVFFMEDLGFSVNIIVIICNN